MKWIDEIARDFVVERFYQSTKESDFEKAQEVHQYINSKTPEEISLEMGNKEFDIAIAWRYASNYAYRLMGQYLMMGIRQ